MTDAIAHRGPDRSGHVVSATSVWVAGSRTISRAATANVLA